MAQVMTLGAEAAGATSESSKRTRALLGRGGRWAPLLIGVAGAGMFAVGALNGLAWASAMAARLRAATA